MVQDHHSSPATLFKISKRGTGLAHTEAELLDNPVAGRPTLILRSPDFHAITEVVAEPVERTTPLGWWLFFLPSLALLSLLGVAVSWLFWEGIGVWGLNVPVGWAWDITNFVFWVGIGHAGTLISAILFLFRQKWRTSINRSAEAMTIFAVHVRADLPRASTSAASGSRTGCSRCRTRWARGRTSGARCSGTSSRSASTARSRSLFWYVGLIPDLATMRDRAKTRTRQSIYGFFALGWRGSQRHWQHYEIAYLILAGLATPLVLSVHSIVSMDFAVSQLPGWHTTIFPPYFVAGAIFSGFAMVLTLMVICRTAFGLEHIITLRHFDYMAKIMLVTGTMVGYAYAHGVLHRLVQRQPLRALHLHEPRARPLRLGLLDMITCNVISPQIFWFKKARTSIVILFVVSIVDQHRHVVRALRDHRDLAAPRLPALVLGLLPPDDVGRGVPARQLRAVLHDVLPVRALPADGGDRRGQDGAAAGRSALARTPTHPPQAATGPTVAVARLRRRRKRADGPRWSFEVPLLARLPKGRTTASSPSSTTPGELYRACERVRDAGYTRWDAHTPFPVHGLDNAMGLRRSALPWIVLVHGADRGRGRVRAADVGPHERLPAGDQRQAVLHLAGLHPVTFEVAVLFGALGAVFGMFGLNRLPMHHHPLFQSQGLRAGERRHVLHLDRSVGSAVRCRRPPGRCCTSRARETSSCWSPDMNHRAAHLR